MHIAPFSEGTRPSILELGESDSLDSISDHRVGILGAGIAGLYTALILDSLNIEYEILEASGRAGGRIFTYKFRGGDKYDYYDAGAMRFPLPEKDTQGQNKNGVMKRLAELIEYGPLNENRDPLKDSLIPYYFQVRQGSKPGVHYFNGTREPPFDAQGMGVGDEYMRVGVKAICDDVIEPFVQKLLVDLENGEKKGWDMLMANDSYTLQSYMATKHIPSPHLGLPAGHLPSDIINWCGLFGAGVDYALSETVLMSMSLSISTMGDPSGGALEWKAFEGGSETLTKRIEEYLNQNGHSIQFNSRVTAISQNGPTIGTLSNSHDCKTSLDASGILNEYPILDECWVPANTRQVKASSVTVTVNDNETRNYSHVISTLPLPVLRTIDLSNAGLDTIQRNALHEVCSTQVLKVAILFKSNWWTTKLGIVGGQSLTDLPIRSVIYPSYGIDSDTPSKVLIASYTWSGDAIRFGSLATSSRHPDALKELVLRNLAEVHSGLHPDVTYAYLKEQFVDMHVKDWARDEYTLGTFAHFRPGEFRHLYPSLTRPAAGNRLHFAGEAVSIHHAWVVGALMSSWRAVHEYLDVTGQDERMQKFKMLWGENPEWVSKSS